MTADGRMIESVTRFCCGTVHLRPPVPWGSKIEQHNPGCGPDAPYNWTIAHHSGVTDAEAAARFRQYLEAPPFEIE